MSPTAWWIPAILTFYRTRYTLKQKKDYDILEVINLENKNRVPAVERAFDILEYLMSRNEAISIKELSNGLKIPSVTVFRIIKSLESKGYVYKQQNNRGKYVLGAKAVSFGSVVTKEANLSQIANAFMYELARKTGQTVQLGVLFEYQVMYIEQIRTSDNLSLIVPTRKPFAVNISAGGKVLVANLGEKRLTEFLANAVFISNTPNSIIDKTEFSKELTKVKAQGYAIDDEEFARGIRCIAAPIFNSAHENVASLGITGHTQAMTNELFDEMIKTTKEVADKISKALGFKNA